MGENKRHSESTPALAADAVFPRVLPGRGSIGRSLLLSFVILAIIPLSTVTFLIYQQIRNTLISEVSVDLANAAEQHLALINNWFDYRLMDVKYHASAGEHVRFLASLADGYERSDMPLNQYVSSDVWKIRAAPFESSLLKLVQSYDYIHDVYLVDQQGNLLFSVHGEEDLGTSLTQGRYRDTRFAATVRESLSSGQILLADMERYGPSGGRLSSFLVAPMTDENGELSGVFAIQLKLDRIAQHFQRTLEPDQPVVSYLLGPDNSLRTTLKGDQSDVLRRSVKFSPIQSSSGDDTELWGTGIPLYSGSEGEPVLGVERTVGLPGLEWTLVTEINYDKALTLANWFRIVAVEAVVLMILLTIGIAWWLTQRIAGPIRELSDATLAVAAGEPDRYVEVNTRNEVGKLAQTFNYMLQMRSIHEQALEQASQEAQDALKAFENRKHAMDQHAIVSETDARGTITYANERFALISGYSVDELIGKNHRILNSGYHPRTFWQDMFSVLAKGKVWHGEICNRTRQGQLYWVETTIVPFMKAGKPDSYIAIQTDITDRVKTEQALQSAKESAESAARTKSEFLASMSHEIRTPMNGVLGMLGLVLKTDLNREQRHRASLARSSAESLLHLINDILDFSKIEAGKLDLEVFDFDLRAMLGDLSESIASKAQENGLEFVLDLKDINESRVQGDPSRLRQILSNLLSNAMKFTRQGEIVLRAAVHREAETLMFVASVTDTGIGIPEDKQEVLFDAFTQIDASTTREFGGTGLGLAIVKQLCQLMGGNISVSSEPGRGSVFTIQIPMLPSEQSGPVMYPDLRPDLSVMVIDDHALNRRVLTEQLQAWGVKTEAGSSARDALNRLKDPSRRAWPGGLIVDLDMPAEDGEWFCRQVRADADLPALRMAMMTPLSNRENERYFAEIGCIGHFPKPATTSDLLGVLKLFNPIEPPCEAVSPKEGNAGRDPDGISDEELAWADGTRILLVEDNQVNQLVAKGMLDQIGLSCEVAGNGIEALESLRQSPLDLSFKLILMDCQMPEMDGYEATGLIRQGEAGHDYCDIPIIAMTANAMKGDRERCLGAGMDDYISKPVEPQVLRSKLQQWLKSASKETEIQGEAADNEALKPSDKKMVHSGSNRSDDARSSEALPESYELEVVWDEVSALKRVMGSRDMLKILIEASLRDIPEQIEQLGQEDVLSWTDRERGAHSIKGVARNIGALGLAEIAEQLELAARQQSQSDFEGLMPELQRRFASLEDRLKTFLSVTDADG